LEGYQKKPIIKAFGRHEKDTGSTDVQLAILTRRIDALNEHLNFHKHDYHCKRSLGALIGQRRRLLAYLEREEPDRYQQVIEKLGVRK
jgi:small subunit ribosomal protein S15